MFIIKLAPSFEVKTVLDALEVRVTALYSTVVLKVYGFIVLLFHGFVKGNNFMTTFCSPRQQNPFEKLFYF